MSQQKFAESRRISHFLFGSSPGSLIRALRRYGGISGRGWLRLGFIVIGMAAFSPFGFIERVIDKKRIARAKVTPPLFIIGHWRSGTTFLHNLLCQDPGMAALTLVQGCIPWNFLGKLGFLRWCLRRCLPENRLIDRLSLDVCTPMEEGLALANMTPYSFWQAFYFPQQLRRVFKETVLFEDETGAAEREWGRCLSFLIKKLTVAYPGRRLVFKDPANTARIKALLKLYPDAQFIYLQRNPYEVFVSMRCMMCTLLPELTLQKLDGIDVEEHIFEFYRELQRRYELQKSEIPAGNLTEVCYESLEKEPLICLEKMYHTLNLPGWEDAKDHFRCYINSQSNYRRSSYSFDPEDLEKVKQHWF
jgi:omega-hydroxy-beta-dihydromenaquinone-9 sulfotransferase